MTAPGRAAPLVTRFTELVGVEHPVVQTGMGWVAGARLVSATSNAGGLGILASRDPTPWIWARVAGDVLDGGIVLTGGGAMLRGLDVRMSHELGVPVRLAEDPLTAVVTGAGTCVEDPAATRSLLSQVER